MLRRTVLVLFTGFLVLLAGPAHAAPRTTTTTEKGLVETFVDVIPSCEAAGDPYTITTTSNRIVHETVFDDGRVHVTFTDTGTFVAVPLGDRPLPNYTGKFTAWGGFNANRSTVNGTFTFTVRGTGSDGSTFAIHNVDHFNVRPDGTVNEFFHCR